MFAGMRSFSRVAPPVERQPPSPPSPNPPPPTSPADASPPPSFSSSPLLPGSEPPPKPQKRPRPLPSGPSRAGPEGGAPPFPARGSRRTTARPRTPSGPRSSSAISTPWTRSRCGASPAPRRTLLGLTHTPRPTSSRPTYRGVVKRWPFASSTPSPEERGEEEEEGEDEEETMSCCSSTKPRRAAGPWRRERGGSCGAWDRRQPSRTSSRRACGGSDGGCGRAHACLGDALRDDCLCPSSTATIPKPALRPGSSPLCRCCVEIWTRRLFADGRMQRGSVGEPPCTEGVATGVGRELGARVNRGRRMVSCGPPSGPNGTSSGKHVTLRFLSREKSIQIVRFSEGP